MKIALKINLLFVFLLVATAGLHAQKFGHLNSGNILSTMPGTSEADSLLKIYQDSLVAVGEAKAVVLEQEFNEFYESYQAGEVTPAVAQRKQQEFQQREQALMAFEEEASNLVSQRRYELLEPILTELQKAVDEVGKEGGYTMIFDTSIFNAILFANDSEDLEKLVMARLKEE